MFANRVWDVTGAIAFRSRLAPRRPASLGLGPLLGLTLAAVTLVACLGWRASSEAWQSRMAANALNRRLSQDLTATAAYLRDERSRTLLTADAVADTPGLADAVEAKNPRRTLQLVESRHKDVPLALLGAVEESGKLLAADPATNLPLASTGPVRQALAGKGAVATVDGSAGLALIAASPIRQQDRIVGAALAVQPLDDRLMDTAQRGSGFASTLLLQGHVVAATPEIRARYTQSHAQPVALVPSASPGQPSRLTIGATSFAVVSQNLLSLGQGREVTLVVGEPSAAAGTAVFSTRFLVLWGSPLLAAVLAGVVGWGVGRRIGQEILRLAPGHEAGPSFIGREVTTLAARLGDERAASIARDATARAEIERLRGVLDAIQDGVIVSGTDRTVILANATAQRLLGLERGSQERGGNGDVLARLPLPDGSAEIQAQARALQSYSTPIQGGIGVVTVLHDATAEHESERLKSEFLSIVSHELQTPLAAVSGAVDLLLDSEPGSLTAEQTRFLNAIQRNSHRLISLVSDLLDVSRLEAGRVELERSPVDLGVLARAAVKSMANLFEQHAQMVALDVADAVPPALGDLRRIEQILANLLANASQYTPSGGQIRVGITTDGWAEGPEQVVVSVADDGPGISPADQTRIFDKFYRGDNAAARRERGSGLGLSIVRSLVELHGGRVWVESVPGKGARFSVALPVATGEDE